MTYTKTQLITALKAQIPQSREKICRALMLIYDRQTEQEILRGKTIEDNSIGFTALDADILTKMARFYQSKGILSYKQLNLEKTLITKYAGQIVAYYKERGQIKHA